jgi:hypothetical protein
MPLINAAMEGGVEGFDPSQFEIPSLVYTPTEPLDLGTMGALSVGGPWLFSKLMGNPISLGRAAALGFGPVALPFGVVGDITNTFLGPVADPHYQLGLRGYWDSLGRSVGKNIKQVGTAAQEARERYGALGIPVQMTHGLMNPITSAMYMGKNLKEYLLGPSGGESALGAHDAVNKALERM